MRHSWFFCIFIFTGLFFSSCQLQQTPQRLPNIILVVADDLGYGDLGSYGQTTIQTPYLDQMARDGIRFTNFYAGSTVCAPSRAVLMTGIQVGRNEIRGNKEVRPMGQHPLKDGTVTLAEALKEKGYTTGLIGKWGLGGPDSEGEPNKQGFDYFYGYLGQRHAHNFYPEFLFRNTERVLLAGNRLPEPKRADGAGQAESKVTYSHDVLMTEAIEFIESSQETPFFLLLTVTIPHANNEAGEEGMEVPEYESYVKEEWPEPQKGLASMITRMDRGIGTIMTRLEDLELSDETLIMFTSDNGPHAEGGNDPTYFNSSGPLRGIKRDLYEGGIRVPLIAKWPGTIEAGTTTNHIGYFGDFMGTLLEISDQPVPDSLDSISFLPTLKGSGNQASHPYLYWEFYERGSRQAVRYDSWKAVRQPMFTGQLELYNLDEDIAESRDVAADYPEIAERMELIMTEAHVSDTLWQIR